ncbi:MAG: thiopurine S-methyltransferase [Gammaproteobacteria bacterium]|nr:thiopurine S-methyltransferase [Gammaproteobacteria bacterium]MDH3859869.1 thiopurine S-methyltransferase [Gammaproteobacteria bacterium]
MVDNQHWLDRWKENRIGFHETAVNQYLKNYLPQLALPKGATVFMPLCGKALDINWLAQQGYEVIGIELSQLAVEAFFEENSLDYERVVSERFVIYTSGKIRLLQGDFFDLRNDDLSSCHFIYDRAALIAMELADRPRYYTHMISIIPRISSMLLITLEYDQSEMLGPPFSVPTDEVYRYYSTAFSVNLLESNEIVDERPRWRKVGLSALRESVFHLESYR